MKYLLPFMLLAVLGIAIMSFNTNEKVYSCNEELNNAVTENAIWLSMLTRDQLVKYPLAEQKAIFRTFDQIKQRSIWEAKLTAEAKNFEGKQKDLILSALDVDTNSEKELKRFARKMRKHFSEEEGKTIFNTLYMLGEYQKPTSFLLASNKEAFQSDCNCEDIVDFCGEHYCIETDCEESLWGCGLMWMQMCWGECSSGGGGSW